MIIKLILNNVKYKNRFYNNQPSQSQNDNIKVENKAIFLKNKIKYLNLNPNDLNFDYFKEINYYIKTKIS